MNSYVTIDGNKYAVAENSYIRKWVRQFTMNITAVTMQINFVDRGPGVRTYIMDLLVQDWPPDSVPYKDGITGSWSTQKSNLETSYGKTATSISFTDPTGYTVPLGVYFLNLTESIPKGSTNQSPRLMYNIELVETGKEVV